MPAVYFPIGITPTKPLTPTHVRGLLHIDGLVRIHRRIEPVLLAHNRRLWDLSQQTLGFWDYLDLNGADLDFCALGDVGIGAWYRRYAQSQHVPDRARYRSLLDRVRDEGYVHPASAAILRSWSAQVAGLGLDAGVLLVHRAPACEPDVLLAALQAHNMLLDQREFGGGAYLDQTALGGPLRPLLSEDGIPNYLLGLCQEIYALAQHHAHINLFFDTSVERDFMCLHRFIESLGRSCTRVIFPRVTTAGLALSYRQSDGRLTLGTILARYAGQYSERELGLALRLYFLQQSGIRQSFDFAWAGLDAACVSAQAVLDEVDAVALADCDDDPQFWLQFKKNDGTVNLYRCLSSLLSRRMPKPQKAMIVRALIDEPLSLAA